MSEFGEAVPDRRESGRDRSKVISQAAIDAPVAEVAATIEPDQDSTKRPWYFSTTMVALAYFLFSPLGSLLILTDRRRGKKAKIRAVAVLLFSLSLLTYRVFFMPPVHF